MITCFDPFGGETENASMAAVFGLPEKVGNLKLKRRYSYGKTVALTTYVLEGEEDE